MYHLAWVCLDVLTNPPVFRTVITREEKNHHHSSLSSTSSRIMVCLCWLLFNFTDDAALFWLLFARGLFSLEPRPLIMAGKPTGTSSFEGRQCRFRCRAAGSHDLSRSPPANSATASNNNNGPLVRVALKSSTVWLMMLHIVLLL